MSLFKRYEQQLREKYPDLQTPEQVPNPIETEQPPQPVSPEQATIFKIGRRFGQQSEEERAYILIGRIWRGLFASYQKAQTFLKNNPEIRRRKPSKQRLEVHVGDLLRKCAARDGKRPPTDGEIQAFLDEKEKTQSEIRRNKCS